MKFRLKIVLFCFVFFFFFFFVFGGRGYICQILGLEFDGVVFSVMKRKSLLDWKR